MKKSDSIAELGKAMALAQGQVKNVTKDANNPFFGSNYATLDAVWEAIRGPLSKNNLSIIQTTDFDEKGMYLETMILHSSGEWLMGTYPIRPEKSNPQGLGSAITYARRYALMAAIGIAPEDDDGEEAVRPKYPSQPKSPRQPSDHQNDALRYSTQTPRQSASHQTFAKPKGAQNGPR